MGNKKISLIILSALALFFCIYNYKALEYDNTYIAYNTQDSYIITKGIYSQITDIKKELWPQDNDINDMRLYPPFFYLSVLPYYFVFGVSEDIMAFSLVTFLIILIFSVYKIGEELFNERTGLISAAIIGFFPGIIGNSRNFSPDFPILSIASLAYLSYFKSEKLAKTNWSVFLGVSLGIGLLLKLTFVIYLMPLAIIFLNDAKISFDKKRKFQKKALWNLALAASIFIFIIFPWYAKNLAAISSDYLSEFERYNLYEEKKSFPSRFIEYTVSIPWEFHLGPVFSVIALISLLKVFIFQRKEWQEESKMLVLWIGVTLAALSAVSFYPTPIFSLPVLAPLSILIGKNIDSAIIVPAERKNNSGKRAYAIILIFIALLLCYYIYLNMPQESTNFDYPLKMLSTGIVSPVQINYSPNQLSIITSALGEKNIIPPENFKVMVFSRQPPSNSICPEYRERGIICYNYLDCKENKELIESKKCESFFSGKSIYESILNSDVIIAPVKSISERTILANDYEQMNEDAAIQIINENFYAVSALNTDFERENTLGVFVKKKKTNDTALP